MTLIAEEDPHRPDLHHPWAQGGTRPHMIPTFHNFAFVVPVWDDEDPDDLIPALDDNCVGYQIFYWETEFGGFVTNGRLYDDEEKARADALKIHMDMRNLFKFNPEGVTYLILPEPPEAA
ncbi:hypothetical protein MARCHEWKA_03750 [Brevundimonas phage vB_BpoS-Marchewka]|uniref:Uncharacterized protein n=1 Tax=Brevundimonas phage vB_BpoS-Marchewka TaxID=2948604 RepID=A0A9E7N5M9_9CAUD|nr:hypothetical protein MARCHEWKA_03750 [Brevundimonas phage vB_BpoS-Marchewka]UTC29333.1 hypothetical protein BAMBUS_02510 [Brevundimonas phage vB_BpoS-Bambus]